MKKNSKQKDINIPTITFDVCLNISIVNYVTCNREVCLKATFFKAAAKFVMASQDDDIF